jgi:HlyD family secretion protein
MTRTMRAAGMITVAALALGPVLACNRNDHDAPLRASGYVEATEIRVAPEVGGRVVELAVEEGDRVEQGALIAKLSTADTELAIRRAEAERDQAVAQLRLLQAGPRQEEIRQAAAQLDSAQAEVKAAESELQSATADLERFEALLRSNSGSRKQRDDAATRREVASARVLGAKERARAAAEALARLRAGARPE